MHNPDSASNRPDPQCVPEWLTVNSKGWQRLRKARGCGVTAKRGHSFQLPWSHLGHMDTAEIWVQGAHSAHGQSPQKHLRVLPPESTEGGSGSCAPQGHEGRAHAPSPTRWPAAAVAPSKERTHRLRQPARGVTHGRTQTGFTDTEVTSAVTGPQTTAKADPSHRDREESSHHFWPGYI